MPANISPGSRVRYDGTSIPPSTNMNGSVRTDHGRGAVTAGPPSISVNPNATIDTTQVKPHATVMSSVGASVPPSSIFQPGQVNPVLVALLQSMLRGTVASEFPDVFAAATGGLCPTPQALPTTAPPRDGTIASAQTLDDPRAQHDTDKHTVSAGFLYRKMRSD